MAEAGKQAGTTSAAQCAKPEYSRTKRDTLRIDTPGKYTDCLYTGKQHKNRCAPQHSQRKTNQPEPFRKRNTKGGNCAKNQRKTDRNMASDSRNQPPGERADDDIKNAAGSKKKAGPPGAMTEGCGNPSGE